MGFIKQWLPYILAGISAGGQYALIAVGYTMVYGILRLINFAHGDIFMVAGLIMVYLSASMPLYVSIPAVVVLTVALGFAIERCAYKLPWITDTITILGASTKRVTVITPILTLLLVVGLVVLIKRTKVGMAMRAASKDFETAQLMGIRINSVISFTFIIGSALAAVASFLYFSNYTTIAPSSGAMPGLKAFVAAVFGGIGSIPGAVIGAFIIGICENLLKGMKLTAFSDAFTFALLIVILVVKPTGLFGEKLTEKV